MQISGCFSTIFLTNLLISVIINTTISNNYFYKLQPIWRKIMRKKMLIENTENQIDGKVNVVQS